MKKVYIELKWAIIFSIALLSWIFFEKTMGWQNDNIANFWWLTLLFAPVAIFFYLLALREKRRRVYDRKMTWNQGFISGLIISVFVALLSPLTEYVAYNFFTSDNFNTIAESSVTNELMARSKMNDIFRINNYRWQSAFGLFVFGTATAATAAIFVRK